MFFSPDCRAKQAAAGGRVARCGRVKAGMRRRRGVARNATPGSELRPSPGAYWDSWTFSA